MERYPEEAFFLSPKEKNLEIDIKMWVGFVRSRPHNLAAAAITKVERCIPFDKSQHESLVVYLIHPLYHDDQAALFIKQTISQKPLLVRLFSANVKSPTALVAPPSSFTVSIQRCPVQPSSPFSHDMLPKYKAIHTMYFEGIPLNDVRLAEQLNTQLNSREDQVHGLEASFIGSVFDSLKDTVRCRIIEERPQRRWCWSPLGQVTTFSHEAQGAEGAEGIEGAEGTEGTEDAEGTEGAE